MYRTHLTLIVAMLLGVISSADAQFARLKNDTLRFKACQEGEVLLTYEFTGCDAARMDSIAVTGFPQTDYSIVPSNRLLRDGQMDTSRIRFFSKQSGTYPVVIKTSAVLSDWQRTESSFAITVIVEPNPGMLSVNFPDTIDFGMQSLCIAERVSRELLLSNIGCEDLRLRSVRLEVDQQPSTEYVFTGLSNLTLVNGASALSLPISFMPTLARVSTARLIIEMNTGIDTIYVRGGGIQEERAVALAADTLKARMCETGEAMVYITNRSCRLVMLDSLRVPLSSDVLPGQLPVGLQAGKSVQLRIRYSPDAEGPKQINALAFLRFIGSETVAFDTILPLNVFGLNGTPLTATSDTTINVGDVSICSETSASIRVESFGCDTLTLDAALGSGNQGFSITSSPATILPQGEATAVSIRFVPPGLGAFTTELIITSNAGTRKVTLMGRGVSGTRTLSTTASSIDFGETTICEERDTTIRFKNTGCDTLVITDANIARYFRYTGELPVTLAPGDSIDLPITTIADTTGKQTRLDGTLTISSNADNTITPITLTRTLVYPTRLRLEAADEANGKAGDEVKFKVILEGDVPKTMTALHFDFLHNNDLLSFEDLSSANLRITQTTGDEVQRQSFTLSPVTGAGIIGELSFKAFMAAAETTTLTFDNIRFEAKGLSVAPECIAVISDSGSRFNYVYTCGDNIIRDRLNGTRLIKSITPNPASGEIRLELNAKDAQVAIIDMLGAEVMRTSTADRIDVSTLPSGAYYIRVSTPADVQTKRVVIQR